MSKGVKKVVGVVASIAIPFAAPILAGAIGLSSAIGTMAASVGLKGALAGAVSGAIGSGVIGAGLGATAAALTGGDVGQGALWGGLGSGLAGGLRGFSAARAAANATTTVPAGTNMTIGAVNAATPAVPGAGVTGAGGFAAAGANATPGVVQGTLGKIAAGLGEQAPAILKKAAIYLAGGALSATSPDEQRLIAEAVRRMREVESQNDQLYRQMLAEAEAIDPNARGEQWHADAQLQGIAATEAAVENVSPRMQGAIPEIRRRGLQNAALNATLAYRQGHESGSSQRRAALTAAGGVPRTNAAAGALGLQVDADARRGSRRAGIVSTLTGLTTGDPGENPDPRIREPDSNEDARAQTGMA